MKFLSRLLLRLAYCLSPQSVAASAQAMSSNLPTTQKPSAQPSGPQCSLSELGPSSALDTESIPTPETSQEISMQARLSQAQLDTLQAQAMYHQSLNLPHRMYNMTSLSHDGVSWIAKAELAEDTVLVGRGNSPSAALMDFDAQWLGVK